MKMKVVPKQILDIVSDQTKSEVDRFNQALPLVRYFLSATHTELDIIKVTQTLFTTDESNG